MKKSYRSMGITRHFLFERHLPTQTSFMRNLTRITLFFLTALSICSCFSNRKLIEKTKTEFGSIRFYAVKFPRDKSILEKVYAEVDSNDIKRFYSFYADRIVVTDERAKALSYMVIFQKLPDNYDSNMYRRFSRLDTVVFSKAKSLLDTSNYSNLKGLQGAEGYLIEVNYYHGFPKNKMFVPL